MTKRGAGYVELCAADDDSVSLAIDDSHIAVKVVLFCGWSRAVSFSVSDALSYSHIADLSFCDECVHAFDVVGFHIIHSSSCCFQRLDGCVGDVGHHPCFME